MKKLTVVVLKLSLVLSGLMIITNQAHATKGDVETALSLIRQARAALGGDNALALVQNLDMKGRSTRTVRVEGEADRQINGEFELALMPPNGLLRIEKLGDGHEGGDQPAAGQRTVKTDRVIRIETDDRSKVEGDGDGKQAGMPKRQNGDLARYMIGLLLTAPEQAHITFDYAGDGDVDGNRADVIAVSNPDGIFMRLYLDKQSHLPLMMTYQGYDLPPMLNVRTQGGDGVVDQKIVIHAVTGDAAAGEGNIMFKREGDQPETSGDAKVFFIKRDGDATPGDAATFRVALPAPKEVEIQTRFSDYRPVNGVMLPFSLSETINGKPSLVWTIDNYELNSPSTAEKFAGDKVRFTREKQD